MVMFFPIESVCISPPPALLFSGEPKGVDGNIHSHWLVFFLPFAFSPLPLLVLLFMLRWPLPLAQIIGHRTLYNHRARGESADLGDATPRSPHARAG